MNTVHSNITFGKKLVARYNVTGTKWNGQEEQVPVRVSLLDNNLDYIGLFDRERIMDIGFYNMFDGICGMHPTRSEYIVEDERNKKILGIAECRKFEDLFAIKEIGTNRTGRYKGIGKALIAGICKDVRGKYSRINLNNPTEKNYGFYKKCHFTQEGDSLFLLEKDYDKLIEDAEEQ